MVYEDHPTYQNLIGRVEHVAQLGALVTDFTLIKPGALHRANGGYLLLDALKLLTQPFAWEGLKRALCTGEIRIESLGQMYQPGQHGVARARADPARRQGGPARRPHALLPAAAQYDPDFGELFKVAADFEDEIDAQRRERPRSTPG